MAKHFGLPRFSLILPLLLSMLCAPLSVSAADESAAQTSAHCVRPGAWLRLTDKKTLSNSDVLQYMDQQQVVLLGEHHDNADHHRWQLQVLAGLYALRQDMVIGFEMFPQDVQPVLDKWVAGELSEAEFLKQSNWYGNWSFDPTYYMPLFNFARLNRIPMIALNVSHKLFKEVQEKGWEGVPIEDRQGITDPAPPKRNYLEMLAGSFVQHHADGKGHKPKTLDEFTPEEKHAFKSFVQGQQLWDRAMAQNLAKAAKSDKPPLVVGIMGSGHVMDGFGIPHQLADLGIKKIATFVPWDEALSCEDLTPDFAYAVFGLKTFAKEEADKPRLGVYLGPDDKGVKVIKVVGNSVAEASGIAKDDIIVEMAGSAMHNMDDVVKVVQKMEPGTWLPITVLRDGKRTEIVAKFPSDNK